MSQERLQKLLSRWGLASRRQAERLIAEGQVRVNGAIATLGQKADPVADHIEVSGQALTLEQRPQHHYLLLHKPLGVISTCDDPQGRPTVIEQLPAALQGIGLHPVGRLDAYTTGALILTNDGDLTQHLTHPRHDIAKTYQVRVQGQPTDTTLNRWRRGLLLDGRPTRSAQVRRLQGSIHSTELEVVLQEGRNRQIRRVAEQLGHPVLQLHRSGIGPLTLGTLGPGQHRPLTPTEVRVLKQASSTIASLSSSTARCG